MKERTTLHEITQEEDGLPELDIAERDEAKNEFNKNKNKNKGEMGKSNEEFTNNWEEKTQTGAENNHVDDVTGNGVERNHKVESLEQDASLDVKDLKVKKKKKKNRRVRKAAKLSDDVDAEGKDESDTLESGQNQSEHDWMKAAYMHRIFIAFEPFGGRKKDTDESIYYGINKPGWKSFTPAEISLLGKPFQDFLIKVQKGDDVKPFQPQTISQAARRIIRPHLKTSELGNHQPLKKLDKKTYKAIQFLWSLDQNAILQLYESLFPPMMNKYEAYRRVITLVQQISQKTTVENWLVIKKELANKSQIRSLGSQLNKLGHFFRLNEEFPDEICRNDFGLLQKYISDGRDAFKGLGANNFEDVVRFVFEWMGATESRRRFEVVHPQKDKESSLIEAAVDGDIKSLRKAKESHGIDFWAVIHVIHALGLGKEPEETIAEYELAGVYERFMHLREAIIPPLAQDLALPWSESAERHWLVEKYGKEYHKRFKELCFRMRRVFRGIAEPRPLRSDVPLATRYRKLILDVREIPDVMLFEDQGLDFSLMREIQSEIDLKTINGHKEWKVIFGCFPLKLTAEQQQFLKDWSKETSTTI
ncbi:hypothetical protein PtA15_12A241 [Puccinia triticina]|uniref:Uncharacterized protein n=1 Tax=Puccinia triticina TaxID=208348 RepID=A0ABY7D0X0_9BASI|nr:uncharacterized protein PtA15_12A241 [Puccinia triticina]WAQ90253.1 hypothetical protein PtA15_12A241 [Puccinia triticina]